MPSQTSLSDVLRAFFSEASADEALTLCRREPLSELVGDARFLVATPAACKLYGRSAAAMRTWLSLTQPLAEALRSRAIAAARRADPQVPSRYRTELLTPAGEVIPVAKEVREIAIDGEAHWLTRLAPAAAAPDWPASSALALPTPSAEQVAFLGRYSMAETHARLAEDQASFAVHLRDRRIPSILDNISLSRQGDTVSLQTEDGGKLAFGSPLVRLPSGQYLFECQHCGWVWIPQKRHAKPWSEVESADIMVPERCGNPERRCYSWQEKESKGRHGPAPKRDRHALRNKTINPLQ